MSRILKLFRRFQARRRDVVEAKSFLEMSFHKFLRFDSSPIGLIIPETFDFIKCTKKEQFRRYYFSGSSRKTIYVVLEEKEKDEKVRHFNNLVKNSEFVYKYSLLLAGKVCHLFVINDYNLAAVMSEDGNVEYLPLLYGNF